LPIIIILETGRAVYEEICLENSFRWILSKITSSQLSLQAILRFINDAELKCSILQTYFKTTINHCY